MINDTQQKINFKIGPNCVDIHHMPTATIAKKSTITTYYPNEKQTLCVLAQVTQDNEAKVLITEFPNIPSVVLKVVEDQHGIISLLRFPH